MTLNAQIAVPGPKSRNAAVYIRHFQMFIVVDYCSNYLRITVAVFNGNVTITMMIPNAFKHLLLAIFNSSLLLHKYWHRMN